MGRCFYLCRLGLMLGVLGAPTAAFSQNADTDQAPKGYETTVHGKKQGQKTPAKERPQSEVSREDLERRLPRSAPDALRFEPGVFVQQTAHSQGSAFIRGLTGQQTLLLFDGIRLNNSTYRQGPNQYFFTLDAQSLERIDIIRGGGSTRYGSDALGGVVLAAPIEPLAMEGGGLGPGVRTRLGSADGEYGGRAFLHWDSGEGLRFFGGVGGRRMGLLQSAGPIQNPDGSGIPLVPRYADDGRSQLGTGFDELSADGRLVYALAKNLDVTLASYLYRQYDAPRTDQCPAAFAPFDECLRYEEQFRTLVYAALNARLPWKLLKESRASLSWQRQHERRRLDRPSSNVVNGGRDDVDAFGVVLFGRSRMISLAESLSLGLEYGLDTYVDHVSSSAWIQFSDIGLTQLRSRGQYLDGSTYLYGGSYITGRLDVGERVRLRAGGRVSWIQAEAPADEDSGSAAVSKRWFPLVGHGGVELKLGTRFRLLGNVDLSFRAPNLDDMTSRQQTGPGFQFENPDLGPEKAQTYEIGVRLLGPVHLEVWAFRTHIHQAVVKSPRESSACPPNTPRCESSWTRFQLVNAPELSWVYGLEQSLRVHLPGGIEARNTVAWTRGEGPNVVAFDDPNVSPKRVPLSRIPPLNGSAEVLWRQSEKQGIRASLGLRWAALQDRLALADVADERIPRGGTPGFWVMDLRLSYRWQSGLVLALKGENLFDQAYRYHGSSVNGPGRSLVALLEWQARK